MAFFRCSKNEAELFSVIKNYTVPVNNGFSINYDPEKKYLSHGLPISNTVIELNMAPKQITAEVYSYYYEAKNLAFNASTDGVNWVPLLSVSSFPGDGNSHSKAQTFDISGMNYKFFKGTGSGINIKVCLVDAYF